MFSLQPQYTILWSRRNLLTCLPAIAASLALVACQQESDMLAPSSDPAEVPAAPSDVAPEENVAALGTTQRILFMSYPKGGGSPTVTKMDPTGASRAPITVADDESVASWSWDNTRIALVRRRPVGNSTQDDIYIINADGSNGHWAAPTPSVFPVMDPAWSPDGSRLILTMWMQDGRYLAWMDVASGEVTLFNPFQGRVPGFRPSYNHAGTKIIYTGTDYRTIEQINSDGSNHKVRISSSTALMSDASFSPDGTKIAYTRRIAGTNNDEIFVKNLTDGTSKRLTTNGGYDERATWSPDGTKIAFSSSRSGINQIWTMNAATGGSLTRITHTDKWESEPAWTH